MERNTLTPEHVVSCIFTATNDLNAEFPAVAARALGLRAGATAVRAGDPGAAGDAARDQGADPLPRRRRPRVPARLPRRRRPAARRLTVRAVASALARHCDGVVTGIAVGLGHRSRPRSGSASVSGIGLGLGLARRRSRTSVSASVWLGVGLGRRSRLRSVSARSRPWSGSPAAVRHNGPHAHRVRRAHPSHPRLPRRRRLRRAGSAGAPGQQRVALPAAAGGARGDRARAVLAEPLPRPVQLDPARAAVRSLRRARRRASRSATARATSCSRPARRCWSPAPSSCTRGPPSRSTRTCPRPPARARSPSRSTPPSATTCRRCWREITVATRLADRVQPEQPHLAPRSPWRRSPRSSPRYRRTCA